MQETGVGLVSASFGESHIGEKLIRVGVDSERTEGGFDAAGITVMLLTLLTVRLIVAAAAAIV